MQIISYIHTATQMNLRKERKSNKEHTAVWFCLNEVHKQANSFMALEFRVVAASGEGERISAKKRQ